MPRKQLKMSLLLAFLTQSAVVPPMPVAAQSMNMQQMESELNRLDPTPSLPVVSPGTVPGQSQGQFPYPPQQQYSNLSPTQTQSGYSFPGQPLVGYPSTPAAVAGTPAQTPFSPLRALFAGEQKSTPPPRPVSPLQYVMQQFLGSGSSSSSGGSGNDQQKLYNAQQYLQTANNQAQKAYYACQRASYGSDKYARKQAAEEAYYAAQAAHYAAESATSAAAGGSSAAQDAAAQARDAADRAQASADQASSNANNGGGW